MAEKTFRDGSLDDACRFRITVGTEGREEVLSTTTDLDGWMDCDCLVRMVDYGSRGSGCARCEDVNGTMGIV